MTSPATSRGSAAAENALDLHAAVTLVTVLQEIVVMTTEITGDHQIAVVETIAGSAMTDGTTSLVTEDPAAVTALRGMIATAHAVTIAETTGVTGATVAAEVLLRTEAAATTSRRGPAPLTAEEKNVTQVINSDKIKLSLTSDQRHRIYFMSNLVFYRISTEKRQP